MRKELAGSRVVRGWNSCEAEVGTKVGWVGVSIPPTGLVAWSMYSCLHDALVPRTKSYPARGSPFSAPSER